MLKQAMLVLARLPELDRRAWPKEEITALKARLGALQEILQGHGAPWEEVGAEVPALITALAEAAAPPPLPVADAAPQRPASGASARDLKKRLQTLGADLPLDSHTGLDEPLAFYLRRRAAFLPFEGEVLAQGRQTELTDISPERVQEIRAAAATGGAAALAALEQTLQARPLWLTGHRLAFEMAERLGAQAQALAIYAATRHEVARFAQDLMPLRFKEGLAFADGPTQAWLDPEASPFAAAAPADEEAPEGSPLQALQARLAREGVPDNPRQILVTQLNLAQALAEMGMSSLAQALALAAADALNLRDLAAWEGDLAQQIKDLQNG